MSVVVWVIVACEIGFWVLLAAGLGARYVLRRPRVGMVLLASTPVVDLVLLAATVVDLRAGATAGLAHGLAALYIGFSLAHGHRLIAWADGWAAHRFDGAARPARLHGAEYAARQWAGAARTLVAVLIAGVLLRVVGLAAVEPERTETLTGMYRVLGIVLAADVLWALSYSVWPRRARAAAAA